MRTIVFPHCSVIGDTIDNEDSPDSDAIEKADKYPKHKDNESKTNTNW